jgi:DNA-binding CsgD family transcriptional regulator
MMPLGGEEGSLRKEGYGRPVRTRVTLSRLLVRPYAMAGSRWEPVIAGLCVVLLLSIFILEVVTPDVVVGAFALLPLLAAVWVLSSRPAGLIAVIATLLFAGAAVAEVANRVTVVLMGATLLVTAGLLRLYATSLASLLSSRRHLRPIIPTRATPVTLQGIDEALHGLRSLTPRELEVARLAAEGYTASEISSRLQIGVRTVESHLASTYSKLRISSRPQLMRIASSLGATGLEVL